MTIFLSQLRCINLYLKFVKIFFLLDLFLVLSANAQPSEEESDLISKLNFTNIIPTDLISTRSLVLYENNFTKAELEETQSYFQQTGIEAVVELPSNFGAINKDPSYQLTGLGAPMPLLHSAQTIDPETLRAGAEARPGGAVPTCSFRIAGGIPGAKVCWRVEAVRNDRWVQQHGAPIEVEKQDLEKGTYQHPELYGQPESKATFRQPTPHQPAASPVRP